MAQGKDFYIPFQDGSGRIHGICWEPEETPWAVIQVAHGMIEHIGRYEEFAQAMNRAGIAVIGHDHPGHGRTAKPGELGEFAEKNGVRRVNGAMAQVARFAKHKFQGIPHILLGHSMGSFLDAVLSRIMENGWTAQFLWEPEASRNHFCGWAEPSWQRQRGWKEEMDEMSGCTSWFLEAITTILKKEKRNINGCRA